MISESSNAQDHALITKFSFEKLAGMESTAFVIDDAEFVKEALAILDSFANEHITAFGNASPLLVQEVSDVTVTVEDVIQAVQADDTISSTLGSFMSTTNLQHNQDGCLATPHNYPQKRDQASCVDPKTTIPQGQCRGRIRIREQLIQLRSVVKKMETHLETLKSPNSHRFDACADSEAFVATNGKNSSQIGVWKNIAMMQFRARREAELYNAQLRESLSAQLVLSDRVTKLLQSHHPHPFLDENP